MKNLLLASTALVLSAGLAHAQAVTITGEGRMGIQYDNAGFGGSNWRQEQRLTLNFNVSVQADHGLTFGAWTRARMQTGGLGVANQGVFSGSRVWVEANGLRLTFGNQDGAFRAAGASSWALSGHYNGGSWGVGAIVADVAGVNTNFSISANAQLGGGNLYGYIGRVGGANAYGLSYGYGLGGGATLTVGAERVGAATTASVGVAFSF